MYLLHLQQIQVRYSPGCRETGGLIVSQHRPAAHSTQLYTLPPEREKGLCTALCLCKVLLWEATGNGEPQGGKLDGTGLSFGSAHMKLWTGDLPPWASTFTPVKWA